MFRAGGKALPFGDGLRRPQKMLRRHTPDDVRRRGAHRQNTVPPVHRINPKIKYASQADLITMELKEFISKTLTQIAEGVQAAIDASDGKNYLVNPCAGKIAVTQAIRFDLSIESEKEGAASIRVLSGTASERNVNHISFEVSMTYPNSGEIKPPMRPSY